MEYLKVMGSLAVQKPQMGQKVSGVLLKRNFNYHLLNPKDINRKCRKLE